MSEKRILASQITINLSVTLTYHPDNVRASEDFGEGQTPEDYLFERLPSFIDNEINNTVEFPAASFTQIH